MNIIVEVIKIIMSKIMNLSLPVMITICSFTIAYNCIYLYHNLEPKEI